MYLDDLTNLINSWVEQRRPNGDVNHLSMAEAIRRHMASASYETNRQIQERMLMAIAAVDVATIQAMPHYLDALEHILNNDPIAFIHQMMFPRL